MKGMLQSLEAVIAILSVFTVFVVFFAPKEALPEFETITWKLWGFDALNSMSKNGSLNQYALANDTQSIKNKLSGLLPENLNIEVLVCGEACGMPSINATKVSSVSYFITGNANNIRPVQVVLYMW